MKTVSGTHLHSLFDSISPSRIGLNGLNGVPIFSDARAIACRDSNGDFIVLIACQEFVGHALNRVEGAISTTGSSKYRIDLDGSIVHGNFCSLSLSWRQPSLVNVYCAVVGGLISALPLNPSESDISNVLNEYVDLLRNGHHASMDVVKGLWGELWIMSRAPTTAALFHMWRRADGELFDFSGEGFKLEVKTHEGRGVIHQFSHQQLTVDRDESLVASLRIRSDPGGQSILGLVNEIMSELEFSARSQLISRVSRTLGHSMELAEDCRFVLNGGDAARIVQTRLLPKLDIDEVYPFSGIRYTVDLTASILEHGMDVDEFLSASIHLNSFGQL